MNFPMPATQIVARYLPLHRSGLSLFTDHYRMGYSVILSVFLAGFRKTKKSSLILEYIAIFLYPIPYFIIALVVQILFCFVWKIFPVTATIVTAQGPVMFLQTLIKSSILPAFTMLLVGFGWWVISMKAVASDTAEEEIRALRAIPRAEREQDHAKLRAAQLHHPAGVGFCHQLGRRFSAAL